MRRLYKSETDKKLAGVCGGIGEFFDIDPSIIRIVWAILAFSGAGLLVYIVAALILPNKSEVI